MSASRTVSRGASAVGRGTSKLVFGGWSWLARFPSRLGIGIVALLLTLFLFVNAGAVFGASAPRFAAALNAYLLMQAVFMANTGRPNPLNHVPVTKFLQVFAAAFLLSGFILLAIASATGFKPPQLVHETAGWKLVIVTVFVIAYSEEIIFRDMLPDLLHRQGAVASALQAQFVSAIVFAGFHWAVYGAALVPLFIAFAAGLLFGVLKEQLSNGLVIVIAVHAAYNSFALGLLTSVPGVFP